MNLKDKIKAIEDCKPVPFTITEWDTTLYIKPISFKDRSKFLDMINRFKQQKKEAEFDVHLVIETVTDETGNLLFTASDKDWLSEKNGAIINRIAAKAIELINGTLPQQESDLKNS